jgi:hypothetical protein
MPQMQRAPEVQAQRQAELAYLARESQRQQRVPTREEQAEYDREQQRLAAEREKAAAIARQKEREALLNAQFNYLTDQFGLYQKIYHDLPPELLPLEAQGELTKFRSYITHQSPRIIEAEAFSRFEEYLRSKSKDAIKTFDSVHGALDWTRKLTFGKLGSLLKGYSLSTSPPDVGSPAAEALKSVRKLLRRAWSKDVSLNSQCMLSLHKSGGKTIIQFGSSEYGCMYITIPICIAPDSLIGQFLQKIVRALNRVLKPGSVVSFYDGDYQAINPKHFLTKHIVVRSTKDDANAFLERIPRVLGAEKPKPADSSLHLGVPANENELQAVFPGGGADWDLWRNVLSNWQRRANGQGFLPEPTASRDSILQSLAVKKNVVIVAAHARERILYLPAPPPEGSQIQPSDLEAHKDSIAANKPLVYLFCCEVAEVSELKGFVDVLIDCGAAAVIAPQTQIDADKSAQLFERMVTPAATPQSALQYLLQAEQKTGYREMEVFVV